MTTLYPTMLAVPDPGTTKPPGGGRGYWLLLNVDGKLIALHPQGFQAFDFRQDVIRYANKHDLNDYAIVNTGRTITTHSGGQVQETWVESDFSDLEIQGAFLFPGEKPKPKPVETPADQTSALSISTPSYADVYESGLD